MIAGEDHDFDEVNHTYVYNAKEAQLKESEVPYNDTSRNKCFKIYSDKEAMLNALNLFFEELKETNHSKPLYKLCVDIINEFDTWTDIFGFIACGL